MRSCVIFGGAGFVGTHLARHFLKTRRFDHVHLADIRPSSLAGQPGITTSFTDVRNPIPADLIDTRPEWIFNLAAIHREPGHIREEYFETNLKGAHNVCAYADMTGCDSIYFTSSISVYGPTAGPTDEHSPIQPSTPYGGSKYPAELIHEMWQRAYPHRRLIISRPGVLYGPGDPGNIMRMIKAIKKGYFAFPGSPKIHKSYGYIYGLLDSIDFTMDMDRDYLCYNYAETPTQPLSEIVEVIKHFSGTRAVIFPIPLMVLLPISEIVQKIFGFKNPIHPVRVKKAATPTHIIPGALLENGFDFKYTFEKTLHHWRNVAPEDFGEIIPAREQAIPGKIVLKRSPENIRVVAATESTTKHNTPATEDVAR